MARDPLSRSWTEEHDTDLIVLVSQNASWVRMSVRLNRSRAAIRTRASKLGLTLPPSHRILIVDPANRLKT
jgi:hypothetical protein